MTGYAGKPSLTNHIGQHSLASPGVAKSSTIFGWGKGGNVTSAGWQVTLCDPIWHVSSRSGDGRLACKLLYPRRIVAVAFLRRVQIFLLTYLQGIYGGMSGANSLGEYPWGNVRGVVGIFCCYHSSPGSSHECKRAWRTVKWLLNLRPNQPTSEWVQVYSLLSSTFTITVCYYTASEKSGPPNKVILFDKNMSDLSEILHMRTLKHINKQLRITFKKHRTTSILLTFKIHHWQCIQCPDINCRSSSSLNKRYHYYSFM